MGDKNLQRNVVRQDLPDDGAVPSSDAMSSALFLQELSQRRPETILANMSASEVEADLGTSLEALLGTLTEISAQAKLQDLWEPLSGVFRKVGNERHIAPDRFDELFGTKAGDMLRNLGVSAIDVGEPKDGKQHFKISFAAERTHNVHKANISHDTSLEFDVEQTADTVSLSKVKGLKVKKEGGLFTATIDSVTIKHEQDESITIVGKGHWGIFRGSKTITIAPDGTVKTR